MKTPDGREMTLDEMVEDFLRNSPPIPKPWLALELPFHRLGGMIERGAIVKIVVRGDDGLTHMLRVDDPKVGWPDKRRSQNPKIDGTASPTSTKSNANWLGILELEIRGLWLDGEEARSGGTRRFWPNGAANKLRALFRKRKRKRSPNLTRRRTTQSSGFPIGCCPDSGLNSRCHQG